MRATVVFAFALLTACATPPNKIKPQPAPMGAYASWNCARMNAEMKRLSDQMEVASKAQKQAVQGDAIGVFLVGVPVSSLSGGDREAEIASILGQQNELGQERIRKKCL